jgi:glycerate kinase
MLGAETRSGIATILNVVGFQRRVEGATLCLTGEGQLDMQSLTGKACMGVAQAAQAQGVATTAIVGRLDLENDAALQELGMSVVELAPGTSIEDSMQNAAQLLRDRSAAVVLGTA